MTRRKQATAAALHQGDYITACSVDGCDKPVFCKGFCNPHYQKNRLYGTPAGRPVVPRGHIDNTGYLRRSVSGKYVRDHVLVVESIIGKKIPAGAVIHHVNGIKTDNAPSNLVLCQNEAYHQLLHRRQRALDACGNANYRKCVYCGSWDDESALIIVKANSGVHHSACRNSHRRAQYAMKGAQS